MDAEIKRTVISNIGFKIRDTTAAAAHPGWREEREITGDSTQFAAAYRLSRRFQTPGNRETGNYGIKSLLFCSILCTLLDGTLNLIKSVLRLENESIFGYTL